MATRFGSQVKALAPVLDGRDLTLPRPQAGRSDALRRRRHADDELRDARRAGRGRRRARGVQLAPQLVSLRLRGGRVALPRRRRRALAARAGPRRPRRRAARSPARSSATAQAGVRTLFVCNVDNVGATLDPALVGLHRCARRGRHRGARLQAPRRRRRPARAAGGRLARDRRGLPRARGLPARALSALQHEHALDRRRRARAARRLHLERGAQVAWTGARRSSSSAWSASSRGGIRRATCTCPATAPESRFVPVKDADDLAAAQEQIAAICRERLGTRRLIRSIAAVSAGYGNGTDRVRRRRAMAESCSDHLIVTSLRTLLSLARRRRCSPRPSRPAPP